jgi:two-component system, cell cycle sensor histidine kinase and response regulator CckA
MSRATNKIDLRPPAPQSLLEIHLSNQTLFDSQSVGIAVTGAAGQFFEANDTFLKIVGYHKEDIHTGVLNWQNLTPADHHHTTMKAARELKQFGRAKPFQKEYFRKDGSRVPVLIEIVGIKGMEDGNIIYVTDLTELRLAQETLFKASKAATLGQFTSGIIHDFNNILAVIMMTSDSLLSDESQDSTSELSKKQTKVILESAKRASALTRHLLTFSRGQKLEAKVANLEKAIKEMAEILESLLGRTYKLLTAIGPDLLPVKIDINQLEQIVMNLAVNARDAMPRGGVIHLDVSNCHVTEPVHGVQNSTVLPGRYVKLSVKDSGTGIDPQLISQIFDMYFTTKKEGQGTGLGLSLVFGIVTGAGGVLCVNSVLGAGTQFDIYLPAHLAAETAA